MEGRKDGSTTIDRCLGALSAWLGWLPGTSTGIISSVTFFSGAPEGHRAGRSEVHVRCAVEANGGTACLIYDHDPNWPVFPSGKRSLLFLLVRSALVLLMLQVRTKTFSGDLALGRYLENSIRMPFLALCRTTFLGC